MEPRFVSSFSSEPPLCQHQAWVRVISAPQNPSGESRVIWGLQDGVNFTAEPVETGRMTSRDACDEWEAVTVVDWGSRKAVTAIEYLAKLRTKVVPISTSRTTNGSNYKQWFTGVALILEQKKVWGIIVRTKYKLTIPDTDAERQTPGERKALPRKPHSTSQHLG